MNQKKKEFGLIGYPLTHSFSKQYYDKKMELEGIQDIEYSLFSLKDIKEFSNLIQTHSQLMGVNVTIPYKIQVLSYLDHISEEAKEIGAVNCIRISRDSQTQKIVLTGYNTDVIGFRESLKPLLKPHHKKALVLGTGGGAQAVFSALKSLNIEYKTVSRTVETGDLTYSDLTEKVFQEYTIIINTTPLGTFPEIEQAPSIPYSFLNDRHLVYDLIYNPEKTLFLKRAEERGSTVKNGYEMLILQAEKNWEIWTQDHDKAYI